MAIAAVKVDVHVGIRTLSRTVANFVFHASAPVVNTVDRVFVQKQVQRAEYARLVQCAYRRLDVEQR